MQFEQQLNKKNTDDLNWSPVLYYILGIKNVGISTV